MKIHLKYIDGNSDKFWKIEASGGQFIVTYGKNGTLGVSQTKTFASDEECLKAAEKIVAEKIKKGYSENGEVTASEKVDAKTGKISNIGEILNVYDYILKEKDLKLLLPFLEESTKGNLDPIRKHIKKSKRHWMTFIDLALEPGYKKTNKNNWDWGTRGDDKIKEIITLSAIATFDKTDILTFDEVLRILERAINKPEFLEILKWAKPNWVESYILDKFRKSDWINFDYKSLRFLEDNGFLSFNPELYALCLSRFNSWSSKINPRDFIDFLVNDTIANQRDIPQLFNYETNIQNSTFNEDPKANYREFNTWDLTFKLLLSENKLDRKVFIEHAILIQTKEWNNNLKLFFRKVLDDLNLTAEDLIPFQEHIFTYFHNSNPTITNYGSDLIKKIYEHPSFKTKSYFEWLSALMMRSDCKTAIKNSVMVLEKLSKKNPKLNKSISLLIADVFVVSDLSLQERVSKLLLKIGDKKDKIFKEKISDYVSLMQGSIKNNLSDFLSEDDLIVDHSAIENYQFNPKKSKLLIDEVQTPKDWNDILFLFGKFISSDEIIDSEILMNVYITQRHLFANDYTTQLQPYLKQLEKSDFNSILKNYIKNLLINKIPNKNAVYKINDTELITLNTLRLAKPLSEKVLEKNRTNSTIPLLSFPSHLPFWVAPKVLLERIIEYQNAKEEINLVDLSIAISRMPRENVEEALPLLEKIDGEFKNLLSYCLGVSNEISISSNSIFTKLFTKVGGSTKETENLALWAFAARTFYPTENHTVFEKTFLNVIPSVVTPFKPKFEFKEKWNEWKDYNTKEMVRSPSWQELRFNLPENKNTPSHFLYNLDLHLKVEKESWYSNYKLESEANAQYWHSLMPQNDDALACLLLQNTCKTTDGTNNELIGFLKITNQPEFQFSETSLFLFTCCFFQEKKDLRLLASEVLINLVEKQAIEVGLFAEKSAFLINNKYGVLLRFIDGIVAMKDVSSLHNSALFLLLDGIFKEIDYKDKLPTNFKKMIENYLDVLSKTNQKPSQESLILFEKLKDNATLKALVKQILN